jgi:hypothetical protein
MKRFPHPSSLKTGETRGGMQTANFQCGHCGNPMAVGSEFLGQQVRCPHCQQVVVAPPPAGQPPAEPASADTSFKLAPFGDQEDIFAPAGEDLFSRATAPHLEIPTDPPAAPSLSTLGDTPPAESPDRPPPTDAPASTMPPGPQADPSWMEAGPAPVGLIEPAPSVPRAARGASGSSAWFIGLVFVPLISYAVLATVALAILWSRLQQAPPDPFERMPDVDGDSPGARKVQSTTAASLLRRLDAAPLPAKLHILLGQSFRIGDLEVRPERVQRKRVKVYVQGHEGKPEWCKHDSLVLHLRLRNVSAGVAFVPIDNYFDRRWKPGQGPPPLTRLDIGSQHFYGGPAAWYPRNSRGGKREWVEGRRNTYDPLQPGQEMTTLVCTDGDDAGVGRALENNPGKMLWRIQVRRGLVPVGRRQLPAAAVIGVEFAAEQVEKDGDI